MVDLVSRLIQFDTSNTGELETTKPEAECAKWVAELLEEEQLVAFLHPPGGTEHRLLTVRGRDRAGVEVDVHHQLTRCREVGPVMGVGSRYAGSFLAGYSTFLVGG